MQQLIMNHLNKIATLFLLIYFIGSTSQSSTNNMEALIVITTRLELMESEIHQLNRKTGLLELKDKRQDGEIRFLKTFISKILINSSKQNDDRLTNMATMQKRPARLLPFRLLRGDKEVEPIVIGAPSSCKELSQLGHTLNGIYLVKINSSTLSNNLKFINAIFCDFQPNSGAHRPSSSSPAVLESKLGYVNMKSVESGIHFYVQIGNRSVPEKGLLCFDRQVSNIGGGMNLKTGVFTAPKAGVYIFSFSILKSGFSFEYLEILLRLNGNRIGLSSAGRGYFTAVVSLQSALKLKKGDRIDLWKSHGELQQGCSGYCHHFTGSLMEEDLIE